jgi:hypothetical protein
MVMVYVAIGYIENGDLYLYRQSLISFLRKGFYYG